MSGLPFLAERDPADENDCTCQWSYGQWFPCSEHMKPHSQHVRPAPGCDRCEDALREAEEVRASWGA